MALKNKNEKNLVPAQSVYVLAQQSPEDSAWREKMDKIVLLLQAFLKSPSLDKPINWWWVLTNIPGIVKLITDIIKVAKEEDEVIVPASNKNDVTLLPVE